MIFYLKAPPPNNAPLPRTKPGAPAPSETKISHGGSAPWKVPHHRHPFTLRPKSSSTPPPSSQKTPLGTARLFPQNDPLCFKA